MSRVFDGNAANFLAVSMGLGASTTEGTFGALIKKSVFSSPDEVFASVGIGSSGRRWVGHYSGSAVPWGYGAQTSVDIQGVAGQFVVDTWQLVVLTKQSGAWKLYVDGTEVGSVTDANNFLPGGGDLRLSGTTSGSSPMAGKLAHAFVFTRGITSAEVSSLAAGGSPSDLSPTGRLAYYPLEDSSLANEWQADSGVGALTLNGTVATDADNPTITTVPAVTLDQATLTPGGTISGTCTNYSAAPTSPISVSDGTNTDNVAVTISGTGPYTFTGTMPASPTVVEGSVTVTVGEASTTATYNDGVTAGISALTVQQEGSPIAATDWEVEVYLLSNGTEYYNQTSIPSDSQGLIGDITTTGGAVGETVEVLGYSATANVWFRFFTNLVDLEV